MNTQEVIEEIKKPIVPQFVADWYEEHKDKFENSLYKLSVDFYREKLSNEMGNWFCEGENKTYETLVMMHKFGYEVEKEKLYTAQFKINNDTFPYYLNLNLNNGFYFFSNSYNCSNYRTHFTQSELEEMKLWDNPVFDIEEVRE